MAPHEPVTNTNTTKNNIMKCSEGDSDRTEATLSRARQSGFVIRVDYADGGRTSHAQRIDLRSGEVRVNEGGR